MVVQLTSFTWRGFQSLQDSSYAVTQMSSVAHEEELKVLDYAYRLNYYYLVLLGLLSFVSAFSHFSD